MNFISIVVAVALVSGIGSGWYFHGVGADSERVEWQEREIEQREKFEKEFSAAMQRVADQNELNQKNLVEVLNEAEKRNAELANRVDAYRSQRLHITAKTAASCNGNGNVETNKDSGVDGSGAGRVELSGEDSKALWDIGFDAQRVVNQYAALRQLVLDSPQCFEVIQ